MKGHRVVAWPPEVIDTTPLGYLRDLSGNKYPRDIGRSSQLSNGRVLIQFGDTFCFNTSGEFVGLSENTCSLVSDKLNPTLSTYSFTRNERSGKDEDYTDKPVPPFITRFKDEQDSASAWFFKFWSFSGIVESTSNDQDGVIRGWTWLQKWAIEKGTGKEVYQWTGIAEVEYAENEGVEVVRAHREELPYDQRPLFKDWEPAFGSFCAAVDGPWTYAYGQLQPLRDTDTSKDVVLARVPTSAADKRESYEYYDGTSWVKMIAPDTRYPSRCVPVLRNMQHGQIWKTKMFSTSSRSQWAFIGCNATGDSQVIFGRSSAPELPFTTAKLMTASPLIKQPDSAFTYCMYPHPWAFDVEKGDLMITWSEGGMKGNVVAVKVRLMMVGDGDDLLRSGKEKLRNTIL